MNAKRWALILAGIVVLSPIAWAAVTPVQSHSAEKLFKIPKGTWARRMAGEHQEILPDRIRLTLGVRDVLVLNNQDDVPQIFGPTLMMPGQSLKLPFALPSEYQFACTAHASGQMTIVVEPFPQSPWARVIWRARETLDYLAASAHQA